MAKVLESRHPLSLGNLPTPDEEFPFTSTPGELPDVKSHNTSTSNREDKQLKQATATLSRNLNIPSEAASSSSGASQQSKPELPEANYDLIHALASALNKHLKKQDVIGEKSKDFTMKCVDEIIHICMICMKKEAMRKKETEGKICLRADRLRISTREGPMREDERLVEVNKKHQINQEDGAFISISPAVDTLTDRSDECTVARGKADHSVVTPFQGAVPTVPLPIENGPSGQWYEDTDNISGPDKPELYESSAIPQKTGRPVLKLNTDSLSPSFWLATPATQITTPNFGTKTRVTNYTPKQGTFYGEEAPGIRSWQWKMPLSNFDFYRPSTMTYPDEDYLLASSPVFYHEWSLKHKTATVIWKDLSFKDSQEIYRWDKVFCETLTMTLKYLKETEKGKECTSLTGLPSTEANKTNHNPKIFWVNYEWPRSYFLEQMKDHYIKEYGQPQYLVNHKQLLQFLNTRDTICSMSATAFQATSDKRLLSRNGEPTLQASVGFTSTREKLDIRRFTPLICICANFDWYIATAGDEFVLTPTLWDPHLPYCDIEATTTYTLEPKVNWLNWKHDRKAFVGIPPRKIIRAFVSEEDATMGPYSEATDDQDLELTLVAFSFLTLPQGVQYERTIKASVTIHIQPSRQAIQQEAILKRYLRTQNVDRQTCPKSHNISDFIGELEIDHDDDENKQARNRFQERDSHGTHHNKDHHLKGQIFPYAASMTDQWNTSVDCSTERKDEMHTYDMQETIAQASHPADETANTFFQKNIGHKYDPLIDGLGDNFAIVCDSESTWSFENAELRPSHRCSTWASQRSYIEKCVTRRGKMMGLLGRSENHDSDSSETELSDNESRLLKNIPFVTTYGQASRLAWEATVNGGEPLTDSLNNTGRLTVLNPPHSLELLNCVRPKERGVADGNVLGKAMSVARECEYHQTPLDELHTGHLDTPECTIAPTPIRIQPNLASSLEASTSESYQSPDTTGCLSIERTDRSSECACEEWPLLSSEYGNSVADIASEDEEARAGRNVPTYKEENKRKIATPWFGVPWKEAYDAEPWSPID